MTNKEINNKEDLNNESECKYKIPNWECNIFNEYEKLEPFKKLSIAVEIFRYKWGGYTLKTLFWSLVIIFVFGVLSNIINFTFEVEDDKYVIMIKGIFDTFNLLQIWVSFGLGIIAMLFSIISMYLSFYNLELQKNAEDKAQKTFNNLKEDIVNEIKREVNIELKEIRKDMLGHFKLLETQNENISKFVINKTGENIIKKSDAKSLENIEETKFYGENING